MAEIAVFALALPFAALTVWAWLWPEPGIVVTNVELFPVEGEQGEANRAT